MILRLLLVCLLPGYSSVLAESWRDDSRQAVLENDSIEAKFQGGMLYELTDRKTGRMLISIDPADLSAKLPVFGASYGGIIAVDLDSCTATQKVKSDSIVSQFRAVDSTEVTLAWRIERGDGDLVLQLSGRTPEPVGQIRFTIFGCKLDGNTAVAIDCYGVSHTFNSPWEGAFGDPRLSKRQVQPLVALFEGAGSGWFLSGREERIGPANIILEGRGQTVDVTFARGFPVEQNNERQMFEVRLRPYSKHWEDAVDPYLEWMEKGAGYVPIKRKSPAWVRDIKTQVYIRPGDFDNLERVAKTLDPSKVIIGRMVGWRMHPMDVNYPDYRVNETARKWFGRARELGFHVGAHFNTTGVGKNFPDLLERFERGFEVIGTDEKGNKRYYEVEGKERHRYCSTALKDWRQYFITQMKDAVDAGVDLIYIDESMAPMGDFVVDGMTAIEGVMTLEKEIMEAYPHVAVETEQFNTMAARHAAFALSQMPLGHPLSGYIFSRFIHILPEGYMCAPTEEAMMNAFTSWGFVIPSGGLEKSWMRINEAFQKYDLVPDSRLPRRVFRHFEKHSSLGLMPIYDSPVSPEGDKLFGYRGKDGVIAYFEKYSDKRGLVIYEPGKEPKWVGKRIMGVSVYPGPGVVRKITRGADEYADWMVYDGNKLMGLDPEETYFIDETSTLRQDRFHLTSIPNDFAFVDDSVEAFRIVPVDQARDGSFYKLSFTGNGQISMYVPDDMLIFLNGNEIEIDRTAKTAQATIAATADELGVLLAFRKTDVKLAGKWTDLPWQTSYLQRSFYVGQHRVLDYSTEGPVRKMRDINAFYTHVTGTGVVIGKLPDAASIRLQGAYGMREESIITDGEGVVRINGKEVMRIPPGDRPYRVQSFDVDITEYSGRHIMMEFVADGRVHGPTAADWYNPWIVVKHVLDEPDDAKSRRHEMLIP